MPAGSKRIKIAAFITDFSCTFAAVIIVYLMIDFSNLSEAVKSRFSQSRRTGFVVLLAVCAVGHIYRSLVSGYSRRSAYLPDRSHKVLFHSVSGLVLSIFWAGIMLKQCIDHNWLVIYLNVDVILLVLSIIDILVFSVIVSGAYQNSRQIYSSDKMDAAPGVINDGLPPLDVNAFSYPQPYDHNGCNYHNDQGNTQM